MASLCRCRGTGLQWASAARAAGIAHVPEDRHRQWSGAAISCVGKHRLGYHQPDPRYNPSPWRMDGAAIIADTVAKMERFDVRPPDPQLARRGVFLGAATSKRSFWAARNRIWGRRTCLLGGRPAHTAGSILVAIEFIHQRLIELRDAGPSAVLLVSVELA